MTLFGLKLLAHQTEMSVLEVTLCTEVAAQPVDVHWHPLADIKTAFWNAADDLSTYANFMIGVAFRLPLAGWRLVRWVWKWFAPAASPAA